MCEEGDWSKVKVPLSYRSMERVPALREGRYDHCSILQTSVNDFVKTPVIVLFCGVRSSKSGIRNRSMARAAVSLRGIHSNPPSLQRQQPGVINPASPRLASILCHTCCHLQQHSPSQWSDRPRHTKENRFFICFCFHCPAAGSHGTNS